MLQLAGVGHVVARLVLGEDFHQRTELQPPLLLRDPVAEETEHAGSVTRTERSHALKMLRTVTLTRSRSRHGAVTRAETPELCDASPAGRRCPPSWRTLALHGRQASD